MLGKTYALDNAARSRARSLVQRRAPAVAADRPTPPPRDQAARGSAGPRPPLPDGPDPPGGVARALDRHPRRGPRRAPPLAPDPPDSGPPPRAGTRHPGADLFQGRVGLSRTGAQGNHP